MALKLNSLKILRMPNPAKRWGVSPLVGLFLEKKLSLEKFKSKKWKKKEKSFFWGGVNPGPPGAVAALADFPPSLGRAQKASLPPLGGLAGMLGPGGPRFFCPPALCCP